MTSRRAGLSKSCDRIASQFFACRAGTMPLKGVFAHTALTPRRLAISSPRSTSDPTGLPLSSKNPNGGPERSEQYVIFLADAILAGRAASAETAVRKPSKLIAPIESLMDRSTVPRLLRARLEKFIFFFLRWGTRWPLFLRNRNEVPEKP